MKAAAKEETYPDAAVEHITGSKGERKVRVAVTDILKGGREAILEHDGMEYRLRITANGKLILTK
ncbi:hemin uptake protein HemP [Hyphomicrobium sulfonivorans]|uniref:hemin uptake protein HemP n=1 Tax=Hyphomicrobium sulfonivorans TaxID=121290 RepID=UPI00156F5E0D|nr:hemin uptake protein HemP [Hyphomicrobium sulfonivorans]MBI1648662.1 hemin uptake protein HemP [Hyphomicrobium sulfonivorans]NSL70802.1 hemin uptake protein HemP [Hyphomicrobium sulfonivorans]